MRPISQPSSTSPLLPELLSVEFVFLRFLRDANLTPSTHEAQCHPNVRINNVLLPLNTRPKILGVIFDTMFTFAEHGRATAVKASRRNNILRALAGTSWGQHKESLLTTFKAVGRPMLNYAAPVWTPLLSETGFKRLQIAQNAALRTANGCLAMSSSSQRGRGWGQRPIFHNQCPRGHPRGPCPILVPVLVLEVFSQSDDKKFMEYHSL